MDTKRRTSKFTRQARLPRGAYAKTLEEIIAPFRRRAQEEKLEEEKKKYGYE